MFHRFSSLIRFHSKGILSLALLPAFLYGTLPHTACICADGHREDHCRALAAPRCDKTPAANTQCSCCKARRDDARNCCQAKENKTHQRTGLIAAGTCCHPIVEAPAPLVPSVKADAVAKSTLLPAFAPIAEPWFAASYRPLRHSDHLATPPPLDVVIVYLRLTI